MNTQETALEAKVAEPVALYSWNEEIQISVSLDDIAKKLHSGFAPNHPHANLLTNVTMGIAKEAGQLGMLYGALNGWKPELDFAEGQWVKMKDPANYGFPISTHALVDSQWRSLKIRFQGGQIKKVNPYSSSDQKLVIEYTYVDYSGRMQKELRPLSHQVVELVEEKTLVAIIDEAVAEKLKAQQAIQ